MKKITAIYGTTYKDLERENKQLREALETEFYCQYANKCNELYDCTKEEYETMAQCNMKLSLEIADLRTKIDKAIDYIKKHDIRQDKCLHLFIFEKKELLEILGDK